MRIRLARTRKLAQRFMLQSSFLSVVVVALAGASRADAQFVCNGQCLYASPAGTGTVCSSAVPCMLPTAVNRAAAIAPFLSSDLHIVLRGGTYRLAQTLVLGPEHAPPDPYSTYFEPYTGETAIVSGGAQVTGWGAPSGPLNIAQASAPAGATNRNLYVNGVRARRARGYYNAAFTAQTYGYALPGFPTNWPADLELVSLSQWKTLRCRVGSFGSGGAGTELHVAEPCWTLSNLGVPNFDRGVPDWVENAYTLLDEPGEFYLDTQTATFYYIPRNGESLVDIVSPQLETLVRVKATNGVPASRLVFAGLNFQHTAWTFANSSQGYVAAQTGIVSCAAGPYPCPPGGKPPAALLLEATDGVRVERNVFEHLGGIAIDVAGASQNNTVEANVIRDVSSTGVMIGEITPSPPETMKNNLVRNNFVTEIGREYYDGVGLFVGLARETTVLHNEFRNLPYTAMAIGWGWGAYGGEARENLVGANLTASVMQ